MRAPIKMVFQLCEQASGGRQSTGSDRPLISRGFGGAQVSTLWSAGDSNGLPTTKQAQRLLVCPFVPINPDCPIIAAVASVVIEVGVHFGRIKPTGTLPGDWQWFGFGR